MQAVLGSTGTPGVLASKSGGAYSKHLSLVDLGAFLLALLFACAFFNSFSFVRPEPTELETLSKLFEESAEGSSDSLYPFTLFFSFLSFLCFSFLALLSFCSPFAFSASELSIPTPALVSACGASLDLSSLTILSNTSFIPSLFWSFWCKTGLQIGSASSPYSSVRTGLKRTIGAATPSG